MPASNKEKKGGNKNGKRLEFTYCLLFIYCRLVEWAITGCFSNNTVISLSLLALIRITEEMIKDGKHTRKKDT